MSWPNALVVVAALASLCAAAQERPSEDALFGGPADAGIRATEAGASGLGAAGTGRAPVPSDGGAGRPSDEALFGAGATEPAGTGAETAGGSARSTEDAIFGASGNEPAPAAGAHASTAPDRDADLLSGDSAQSRFDTDQEKADPLDVGGTLYLRAFAIMRERDDVSTAPLSAPALVDGYLDARPSDRVRGMLLARMRYDATQPSEPSASAVPGLPAGRRRTNPSIELDQLWIRFDVARTAFLAVGKQHVRWGASRFWNPTDFLSPERKDALAVFDARLGANMVKLHVPWESKGWNFYAIGLLDNDGPADRLGKLGGAWRAELLLGEAEIGLDAAFVSGRRPRYGFDFSSALGPIDVYGELAVRSGHDFTLWRERADSEAVPLPARFEAYSPEGVQLLASGGFTWTFNYTENRAATIGAEYFYNPVGAESARLYPWLLFLGQFQPFYAGKHYLGLYALAVGLPGDLDQWGITASNLGNLSDLSFVSRLDVFIRALSYLQVETYAAVHYGKTGGEFRFGLDLPPQDLGGGQTTPPIFVAAPIFEAGIGLRVSL